MRSVGITWENMQSCSSISKFVSLSELPGQPTHLVQKVAGGSWDATLGNFRTLVSNLYREWQEYLWDSLTPQSRTAFLSILSKTAPVDNWTNSLAELSHLLAKKSGRKVIVLIDDYDPPSFFHQVRLRILPDYIQG